MWILPGSSPSDIQHSIDMSDAARGRFAWFGALTGSVAITRCPRAACRPGNCALSRQVPRLDLCGGPTLIAPHRQVDYLLDDRFEAEFYLTQVVSHHSIRAVEQFLKEARRRGVPHPGVFGVFLYRSANPSTLARLADFFPVPAAELTREFEAGSTPEEICAKTVRALREVGADKVYLSNLGFEQVDAGTEGCSNHASVYFSGFRFARIESRGRATAGAVPVPCPDLDRLDLAASMATPRPGPPGALSWARRIRSITSGGHPGNLVGQNRIAIELAARSRDIEGARPRPRNARFAGIEHR